MSPLLISHLLAIIGIPAVVVGSHKIDFGLYWHELFISFFTFFPSITMILVWIEFGVCTTWF
jgi:hypothetical protein